MHVFSRKERLLRTLTAFVSMLIGSGAVMVLVLAMNDVAPEKEKQKTGFKEMDTVQSKRTPKSPRKKPEPRKRETRRESNAAPAPSVSTSISGLSFDLPGMNQFGLGESIDKMLSGDAVNDVVMTAATVDEPPQPLQEGRLTYPDRARRQNIEGYVLINMLIDASGAVEQVKVLESQPPGVFEDVTTEWARGLRFTPAYYKGKPVKTWARRRVPFKLS